MKKLFLILMFCPFLYVNTQTNFDNGYQRGWKEGYCYNHNSPSCIPPIPPISPIPRIGEDTDNYKDGYNRGFADGLESFKKSSNSNNNSSRRFQTSDLKIVDYGYKPNWELIKKVADTNYERMKSLVQQVSKEVVNSSLENSDKEAILENMNENCLRKQIDYTKFDVLDKIYDCLNSQVKDRLEIIKSREIELKKQRQIEEYNQNVAKHSIEREEIRKQEEEEIKEPINYYQKIYTGNVKVVSYTPLYKEPDMMSEEIYQIPNNQAYIIERVKDGKYYKVKSNGKEGYIWVGFIIE